MGTITRELLSASTNGRYINITTSGTPGDLLHTATSTADQFDEVWLWAVNNTSATAAVVIEWGGTDTVLDVSNVGIPAANGETLLVAGRSLAGGLSIRAYSDHETAVVSGVNIGGHINRVTN